MSEVEKDRKTICQSATTRASSPEVSPLQLIVAVRVSLVQLKLSSGIVVSPRVATSYFQLAELWYVVEQRIKQDRHYEVDRGVLGSDTSN